MTDNKKKSLSKLKNAIKPNTESLQNTDFNSFQRILTLYFSTPDLKEFERKYKKLLRGEQNIAKLHEENHELFLKELERAFYSLAAGTVYEEKTVKKTPRGIFTETKTKQKPPDINALKFLLMNFKPEKYRENTERDGDSSGGTLAELMEAVKNVK